jgi:ABC-type dipeptide/oligopeptide/nickel transport system permease component/ABC-type transport system substrate-binding protein
MVVFGGGATLGGEVAERKVAREGGGAKSVAIGPARRFFTAHSSVKNRLPPLLAGYLAAAFGLAALLWGCAWLLGPDGAPRPARPPAELAQVQRVRAQAERIDPANAPVVHRPVDYAAAGAQPWRPRGQAPVLAELVRAGRLPPVAQRTGPEPVVLEGPDGIGRYGGTWHRLVNSATDYSTVFWRLSSANLVRWSPQGYPIVPHVAKGWEVSADQRVFTFELRRGMRWSDGAPLGADDIVFWYEHEVRFFNVQPKFLRAGATLGRVAKVDDLRVRFEFDQPNPLFLERLASTGMNYEDHTEHIVPAHYLRRFHPALGEPDAIREVMTTLGLGSPVSVYKRMKHHLNAEHPRLWPWVLRSRRSTPPQTFVRNPYYWAVDPRGNQLPYLDRLVLDIKNNNLIAVSAAHGEVSMQDRHIRYDDHALLMEGAERHGYEVYHWKPSTQSLFALFPNLNRRIDPLRPETRWKHELLNDVRFRRALSLAINRADIIRAEFNGQGEPAQIAPPPDSPYHHPALTRAFTAFDPARANALLDEIGLTRRDGEGYRVFPDGTRMWFTMNLTDYTTDGPAHFVVEDWARVGVRVIPRARARRLFEQEKLTLEHDFTVWTGESEFYPAVEPRNFVPTYFESFFAPAFGSWYQYGGLHGDPAARRPNAQEPPAGHPLRRAMERLDEAGLLTKEADRVAKFREIFELAAENVRNVPRVALFGANFQTPGNTGIETYFWERPPADPAGAAQVRAGLLNPPTWRTASDEERAGAAGGAVATLFKILAALGAATVLALVVLRHPLVGRRLLLMIPTLFAVSLLVFVLVQLPPGDFATTRVQRLEMEGTPASDELAAELRRNYGLDEPMWVRYARWSGLAWFATFRAEDAGLLQGNFGLSMEHEKSANEVVGDRVAVTLAISLAALLLTWAIALPAGIYSAVRQYSPGDHGLTLLAFAGVSVPSFLLALLVMYLAKRWFDVSVTGLFSPEYASMPGWSWGKAGDLARRIWLPVLVLGAGSAAGMIRSLRANLLDELRRPYVATARAKGVRPLRLVLKYPVRLALNPFVSGLGGLFPQLVSGGTIVALVLSLPMLGPTLFDALIAEDVYLAASLLMVLSVLGVVGTMVSDLALLWLDPRIRLEARSG